MPFLDPTDSVICEASLQGRGLLARQKLGIVNYRALGWSSGRGGYDDLNPVKIIPLPATAVTAQGSLEIVDNTFDAGDSVTFNGVEFTNGLDFTVGIDTDETALNLVEVVNASLDPAIKNNIRLSIDGGNASLIIIDSLAYGVIGNYFPISLTNFGAINFVLTAMTGGVDDALIDPAYPVFPTLGTFVLPEGRIEQPTEESISFVLRIPDGAVGLNGYGEVGIYVEILESTYPGEVGNTVLFASGHFPLQSKTDRSLFTFRVLLTFG